MVDNAPKTVVPEAKDIRNAFHGLKLAHPEQQRLERTREPATPTGPRNVRKPNRAAKAAPDPGNSGNHEASELEEMTMLPDPIAKVVRRLVDNPAVGAVMPSAPRARETKLHALVLFVKIQAVERPGRGKARECQDLRKL